jgi:PAS domain S-box-containing protein
LTGRKERAKVGARTRGHRRADRRTSRGAPGADACYEAFLNRSAVYVCTIATRAAAALAAGVGVVGLLGWVLDVEALKAAFTGGVTIKANAAIGLVLLGAALLLLADEQAPRWRRAAGRALAGAAMALGGLTLAQHLSGYDFGIDQLLFVEPPGALATVSPARMGPPASASFFLSGLALLLLDVRTRRGRAPAQWLALVVGLIALLPLIGYAYSIQSLYGVAKYTGIAVHTAVAIAALAVGLLAARPTAGLMALVCADDAGGVTARRLLLPAVLVPFGLGWLRTLGERAGWFDAAFGRPVLILSLIVSLTVLVWWNARALSVLGRQRSRADEERRRSEEARLAGEERLRALIERSSAGIAQLDLAGRFILVNQRLCDMTGYARDELLSLRMQDITHPDDRARNLELLERAAAGEGYFQIEKRYVRKDGAPVWVNVNVSILRGPDGAHQSTLGVAIDIGDRKRAEAAAQRRTQSLKLLADTSVRLLTDDNPRELIDGLFRQLGSHLGLEVFFCFLVTDDGTRLRLSASDGVDERQRADLEYLEFGQSVCGTVAAQRRPMAVEEVACSSDPRTDLIRSLGITAYACHPLIAHGRLIGTLSYGSRTRTRFTPEDLDLMRAASDQVAIALDRQRLTEELRRRAAELATANAAKDEFLAVLSHELRTPLTPVMLTVSLMESHPALPEDLRGDVATIRRNVELESRLISDLLDLTRIEKGKLQLDVRDVDLHLIVRSAVDICQRQAPAKLDVDLRATRCVVRGDGTRLQQIFWNLINNAIKFTPPQGNVTVRSSDAGDGRVRVDVIDTGAGIDPAVLPRLFNAFEQGDVRTLRQQAGLGLGLAISKRLAEAHGGTIAAASAGRGRGATFTVELPVLDVAAPESAPQRPAPPQPAQRPLTVLLVEDHEPTLNVLLKLLRQMGHRATGVSSVASATAAAARDGFDLIISDLGLPDGSGLDVIRRLRDKYAGRAIALTGYGMDADVAATRAAGFVEHLTKPVDLNQLDAAIRRVVAGNGT